MKRTILLTALAAITFAAPATADPAVDAVLAQMQDGFIDQCVKRASIEEPKPCIEASREAIRYMGSVISPDDTHHALRFLVKESLTECANTLRGRDAELRNATGAEAVGILASCVTTYYNSTIALAGDVETFKATIDAAIAAQENGR